MHVVGLVFPVLHQELLFPFDVRFRDYPRHIRPQKSPEPLSNFLVQKKFSSVFSSDDKKHLALLYRVDDRLRVV